jgi:hypothetical protein
MAEVFKMKCPNHKELHLIKNPCKKTCPLNTEETCYRWDLCFGAKQYLKLEPAEKDKFFEGYEPQPYFKTK